jgi:Domain of unknown function (DUF4440)
MNYNTYTLYLLISVCLFACNNRTHKDKADVEKSMQAYDRMILKMDVDSISLLYTPDGDLGNMAHGRDSIRRFLYKFKNFKVLSQVSNTDSISIMYDTAVQMGTYRQKVIVPVNDTVSVKGLFTAKWIWSDEGGWHIKHMETQPIN